MQKVYKKAALIEMVFILISNAWSALKLGAWVTNILNKECNLCV